MHFDLSLLSFTHALQKNKTLKICLHLYHNLEESLCYSKYVLQEEVRSRILLEVLLPSSKTPLWSTAGLWSAVLLLFAEKSRKSHSSSNKYLTNLSNLCIILGGRRIFISLPFLSVFWIISLCAQNEYPAHFLLYYYRTKNIDGKCNASWISLWLPAAFPYRVR